MMLFVFWTCEKKRCVCFCVHALHIDLKVKWPFRCWHLCNTTWRYVTENYYRDIIIHGRCACWARPHTFSTTRTYTRPAVFRGDFAISTKACWHMRQKNRAQFWFHIRWCREKKKQKVRHALMQFDAFDALARATATHNVVTQAPPPSSWRSKMCK